MAPQGSLVFGDAYTDRYDLITEGFPGHNRVVDVSMLWVRDLEEHILQVCHYLTLTANHWVIQNPDKIKLCRRELEYVDLFLTETRVKPSDEMLWSITNFPCPTNLSGIRSWFGLVEQVAFAFSKADIMAPFCRLLSVKTEFVWSQEMNDAFEKAKLEIF